MKNSRTRTIALLAVLTALNILGNVIVSKISKISIIPGTPSLIYVLACVTGFALGPIYGPISMALGDTLAAVMFSSGFPFNPFLPFTNAWLGLMCALIYRYLKVKLIYRHIILFILIPICFTFTINILPYIFHYFVLTGKRPSKFRQWFKVHNIPNEMTAVYIFLLIKRTPQLIWILINAIIAYPLIARLQALFPQIFVEKINKKKEITKLDNTI